MRTKEVVTLPERVLRSEVGFGVVKDYITMTIAELVVKLFFRRLKRLRPEVMLRIVAAAQQHDKNFEVALVAALQGLAYLIFPLFPKRWKEYAEDAFARLPNAIMHYLRSHALEPGITVAEGEVESIVKETTGLFEEIFKKIQSWPKAVREAVVAKWQDVESEAHDRLVEVNRQRRLPDDHGMDVITKKKSRSDQAQERLEAILESRKKPLT